MLPEAHLTFNFAVVGETRSGAAAVASALCGNSSKAYCHIGLFDPAENIRQKAHEAYYGEPTEPGRIPEWFDGTEISPWQYLSHSVFDRPRRGELALGIYAPHFAVRQWELCELFSRRNREGDFGVIGVHRNPVAAFISLKQAQLSGRFYATGSAAPKLIPPPIRLDPQELITFCQTAEMTTQKVQRSCDDYLRVAYVDVLTDFQATMVRIFDFLELPEPDRRVRSDLLRLSNRRMPERASNLGEIYKTLPHEIRGYIDAEDFV